MKLRHTFIGAGGAVKANVPRVLSEAFGISGSEALRLLRFERVTLDGKALTLRDAPVVDLAGRRLCVDERDCVDLEADG